MSGIFYGLEIARRGLSVSQQAITVTGNNISNASTEGYTRQRVEVESIYPSVSSRFANGITVGGGAEVTDIDQVRSEYIDRQLRGQYSALGQWNTRSEELQFIESILNETSKSGSISAALSGFFDGISRLAANPDSQEIRTNLQQNGMKLCDTLGYYYGQLTDLQDSYNAAMSATTDTINGLLTDIAGYNRDIAAYELGGQQANELRDRRNSLLDQLSQLVDISYTQDADGMVSVTVGGSQLINDEDATLLAAVPDPTGAVAGKPGYYTVCLEGTGTPLDYSGGKLQAYRDLRDGDTAENIGLPYLINSLNTLAQSLAQEFNAVHETGYTIPYGGGASQTGIGLFKLPDGGYDDITAGNISLSDEVMENVYNIAASSRLVNLAAADTQAGNNEAALKLYGLTYSDSLATVGNFENYLKSFIVKVGISSAAAQETSESQKTIAGNLETRRESISGVSIDEEMISLISYQHAYSAASRALTAIDEMLERLINGTGKVGL